MSLKFNEMRSYIKKFDITYSPILFFIKNEYFKSKRKINIINYKNDLLSYNLLNKNIIKLSNNKNVQIILIGSMLVSYLVYIKLLNSGFKNIIVLDRSEARIGSKFFDINISGYEILNDKFYRQKKPLKEIVYINTSERFDDGSVLFYLEKILCLKSKNNFSFYSWRDIFEKGLT